MPASGEAVTPAAHTTVRAVTRSVSPSGARTVTPRASTSTTVRESIGVTPIRSSERRARSDSDGGKLVSTRSPASTSTMRPLPGSAERKLRRRLSRASSAICPAISTPVGPGADDHEREPGPAQLRRGRHLGGLERAQDRRAGDERALERLDLVGELAPRVVAEVGVARAAGDDQRVVGDARRRGHPGHRGELHPSSRRVDRARLGHQHADVARAPEDRAQRIGDFARRERAGRDLVGQRLEEVEVAAVDERDLDRRAAQVRDRLQAAEAAADDDDAVCACRLHPVPPRLEIGPRRPRV